MYNIKELFLENLQKNVSNIKILCVICLLIGLFKNAVNGIEEKGVYEIASFIGQILILSIAIVAFKEMINILKDIVINIIDIIDGAMPLMIGVISLNGNAVHACWSLCNINVCNRKIIIYCRWNNYTPY